MNCFAQLTVIPKPECFRHLNFGEIPLLFTTNFGEFVGMMEVLTPN